MNGIIYPKTHDIDQLIRVANHNNIDIGMTEYIEEHSEMFTLWETRTRYVFNHRLEKKKIDIALKEVAFYFEKLKKEADEPEI